MPRRTLLFLAAIVLTVGGLAVQVTSRTLEATRSHTGKYRNIEIGELTGFQLPDAGPALPHVPKWVRDLDGQPIRLTGEPKPGRSIDGVQFDLTRVGYQRWYQVQQQVAVRVPAGQKLAAPPSVLDVYGTLRLYEPREYGRLFVIDVDRVETSGPSPLVLFPPTAVPVRPPRDYAPLVALSTTTLLGAAAVMLALWHVLRQQDQSRRAHRLCHNLCLSCGYDLRGTCGRCPECGTPVRQAPAAALPGRGNG